MKGGRDTMMIKYFNRILPFCAGLLATVFLALVITVPFFNSVYDPPSSLKQSRLNAASLALVEISVVQGTKAAVETNLSHPSFKVNRQSLCFEKTKITRSAHEPLTFIPLSTHLVYTLTTSSNL